MSTSRMVAASVALITAVAFFRIPLLPELGNDLDLSATALGTLTGAYALGRLIFDLPAGWLLGRVGPMALMRTAAILAAIGTLITGLSLTVWTAAAGTLVLGVSTALTNSSGAAWFAAEAPPERRGAALSTFASSQLLGQTLGPAAAGALAGPLGWRMTQLVGLFIVAPILILLRRDSTSSPPRRGAARPAEDCAVVDEHLVDEQCPRALFTFGTRLALAGVPFVLFLSAGTALQTLGPIIAHQELMLGPSTIGMAAAGCGLAQLAAVRAAGQTADARSRKAALLPALLASAAGSGVLALGSGAAAWLLGLLLVAAGSAGVPTGLTILADVSPPAALGREIGWFRLAGDTGLVVGPVCAAAAYESFGRAASLLPLAAVVAVAGLVVALVVPDTASQKTGLSGWN